MKTAMLTICTLGIILAAYGLADRIEQHSEARIALAEAYREGCLPKPGETSIIVSDGRRASCRIYGTASTARGMAPRLVSAAAVQIEPAP